MPTAVYNQAPSPAAAALSKPSQGSSGSPDDFKAHLDQADPPDPGGGPPKVAADGGASNSGPNAQSNQPDLSSLNQEIAALPATGITSKGTSTKSGKVSAIDPTLAALGVSPVPVTPTVDATPANVAEPIVASASAGHDAASLQLQATNATAVVPVDPEPKFQITVDSQPSGKGVRGQAGIQNATVSSIAENAGANIAEATAAHSGGAFGDGDAPAKDDQGPARDGAAPQSTPNSESALQAVTSPTSTHQVSAAPATASQTLSNHQRLDVVRQVADRIELMTASRPQQGVTIQLQPHGLGDVTIVVKGVGKDIEATLSATNSSVRNALADSRDSLTQAVTAKGYNLIGVTVAAHAQSMSGQGRQTPNNPQQSSSQSLGQQAGGGASGGGNASRGGSTSAPSTSNGHNDPDAEYASTLLDGVDYRI